MTANVIPIRNTSAELKAEDRDWFTLPEVCAIAGISARQADHWTRTGLLVPTGEVAPGNGVYRHYSQEQVDRATAVSALLRAGLYLPQIRKHIDTFTSTGSLTTGPVTITYLPEK